MTWRSFAYKSSSTLVGPLLVEHPRCTARWFHLAHGTRSEGGFHPARHLSGIVEEALFRFRDLLGQVCHFRSLGFVDSRVPQTRQGLSSAGSTTTFSSHCLHLRKPSPAITSKVWLPNLPLFSGGCQVDYNSTHLHLSSMLIVTTY